MKGKKYYHIASSESLPIVCLEYLFGSSMQIFTVTMVIFAGISGDVTVDNKPIENWEVYPLEFKKDYINK